jgi:hypothetical protein
MIACCQAEPIVCCLAAGEYKDRIVWIESLAQRALHCYARDDLVLRLSYTPDAVADVRKMVERERICCAFLTFDLDAKPDTVCVTITAPEAARDSVDMLFGPFLAAFLQKA